MEAQLWRSAWTFVRNLRLGGVVGRRGLGCFLGLLLISRAAWASPAEVFLLRHAEKPNDEQSFHLSQRGEERARGLVGYFTPAQGTQTNALPAALFAAQITRSGHGCRPYETLEPLAKHLNLPIQIPYASGDYAALAKRVLQDSALDGKVVVICWTHEALPELAAAFGVKPQPAPWKGEVFDRVWRITFSGKKAFLSSEPQRLLPGDSAR